MRARRRGARSIASLVATFTTLGLVGLAALPAGDPPSGVRWLTSTPDDPDYAGTQASYLGLLELPSAWDVTTGSDDVIVAVLDSGVDPTHPDLAGRLVPGTDIVNHDADPSDDRGPGTRMAGISAATTNNRLGVAGVAWAGKVMPVKVAGPSAAATDQDVADGIRWAADHGAKVISLSLGAPGGNVVLQQAVDYALARDVVVVAAAGNAGSTAPEFPAACRGVVAVGSTDAEGRRTPFSNYGRWVDVNGPGEGIITTTVLPTGYTKISGTSATTALVSGVAALVRAAHPGAGQAEVADRLRRSGLGRGPVGAERVDASGVVDAAAALRLPDRSSSSGTTGYWILSDTGRVDSFGDVGFWGDGWGEVDVGPAVDLEPLAAGRGYWLLDESGNVRRFGRAPDLGGITAGQRAPGEKAVALVGTPGGDGYWLFTDAGRVFPFGAARSFGDLAGVHLNRPVVDAVGTSTGKGYLLVADDGGVFTFGDARFAGSMGGQRLNAPIRSLALDRDGNGYWLAGTDGGVFAFDAPYRGSLGSSGLNAPVRGMAGCGDGYLLVSSDGGVFDFSNCPFAGSLAGQPTPQSVVGLSVPRGR
jgi:hypothetical protein